MATAADDTSSSEKKNASLPPPPQSVTTAVTYDFVQKLKTLEKDSLLPWIDYAVEQAQFARRSIDDTLDTAIHATKSRVDRIWTTSSAHFNQTLDSLQDVKSDFGNYEDFVVGKFKEGVNLAASNPLITAGCVLGVGLLGLKRPRRFLYCKIRSAFVSESVLLSRADAKVKELQQSFAVLKAEAEKLEKAASLAEDEMIRGRTKLRQAGKQMQGAIRSAYKIERQAEGLKDVLRELPSVEASRFRSQVSSLAKQAKKEKSILNKEVIKISNYGISV